MKDYKFFFLSIYINTRKKKDRIKILFFILFDYQTGIHGARGRVVL